VETGISPNAVSLIGLGFALLAASLYAVGGYWFALAGALVGWFSSMLDGCDGEVARLTYRESALGAWLEAVCDDVFYVAIFLGMTMGLVRGPDADFALVCGAAALVGAVATFALHYVLRARVAAESSPAEFARVLEARMAA